MTSRLRAVVAAPIMAGLVAAPVAAHADWYHRGGYGYGGGRHYEHYERYEHRRGIGPGGIVAGALLGLGAAAVVGSVLAPPAYYAPPPPPVYYAPPPVVYAPPPAYYPPPGYYP